MFGSATAQGLMRKYGAVEGDAGGEQRPGKQKKSQTKISSIFGHQYQKASSVAVRRRAVLGAQYWAPLDSLAPGEAEWARNELTVPRPPSLFGAATTEAPPPFEAYDATSRAGFLGVPRFWGVERWGVPARVEVGDDPGDDPERATRMRFAEGITLRGEQHQPEAVKAVMERYGFPGAGREGAGGYIKAYCGIGKTVISLYVAAALGGKTLVVVNSSTLLDQWVERVREYLPNARIGVVQQKRAEVDGVDVVIAMHQSIVSRGRAYPPGTWDGFRLAIYDEAHHLGGATFSTVVQKISPPPRYVLGVTATPDRFDGCHVILDWGVGGLIWGIERPRGEYVRVHILTCDDPTVFQRRERGPYKNGAKATAQMINWLVQDEARNREIARRTAEFLRDGRRVLVLSERVAHLDALHPLVWANLHRMGLHDEKTLGVVTGKTPKAERAEILAANCNCLFSTFHLFKEGADKKELDTLVMASPITNCEQAVGRILRKCPGKQSPLVLDVSDTHGDFGDQAFRRRRFWRKSSYHITRETVGTSNPNRNSGEK